MERLSALVSSGEDRIMRILHGYTLGQGYAKYSSTLEEAWRMSVRILSATLVQACKDWDGPPELGPDDDYLNDPIAQFGIVEAQRHRERGISIDMFLGLLKYYRQSYLDLVIEAGFEKAYEDKCRRFVDRVYDRFEIGLCKEWVGTDQTQLTAELQASNRQMTNEKNKYLTVFESSANPQFLLNRDLKIENLNHAAVQMFKGDSISGSPYFCAQHDRMLESAEGDSTAPSLGGQPVAELFPALAEDIAAFAQMTEDVHAVEKRLEFTGSFRYFEVRMSKMLDISEKFSGILVVLTDITERKRAEHLLRENEERLRTVLDATPFPIAVVDLQDDKIHFWSRSARTLFGHTAPTASEWYQIAYPDPEYRREVIDRWKPFLAIARESRQAVNTGEYRVTCGDGSERICELYASFLPDILVVTFSDITERKRAEEALRQSEERLSVTLRSIGDGVITTDTEGRVVLINQVAEELTGWPQSEAAGRRISEVFNIINEHTRQVCENPVDKVLEAGTIVGLANHTLLVARDGATRVIADSGAPIRDGNGRVIGVVLVFRDITQRVLIEGELRQAQKMEAIGTLAGGIAHDFNNILGAVVGFAEMAMDDAKSGKVDPGDLDQILLAAQRAKSLVQQILAFSRKTEPDSKPLDLNQAILKTRNVLERTLPKMIAIETKLAENLPPILADPTQMEQVLLNLASNAGDAMSEGGMLVLETQRVTLDHEYCLQHLEVRPGRYVLLLVTDTGTGMDKETISHIFDPFFTTKEIGKGTGLGLSTVYGIVKNHGGHIHCYSELGMGTTFKLYFPAFQEGAPSLHEELRAVDEDALTGTETILLVDDEEALRGVGSRSLRSKGYQVLTATSGEEALEIYRQKGSQLALVIMDLGMPGMGGHKAMQAVLGLNPRAKVLIASGYAANAQVKAALESGAAGYVSKPYKKIELLATVRSVLDRK